MTVYIKKCPICSGNAIKIDSEERIFYCANCGKMFDKSDLQKRKRRRNEINK